MKKRGRGMKKRRYHNDRCLKKCDHGMKEMRCLNMKKSSRGTKMKRYYNMKKEGSLFEEGD